MKPNKITIHCSDTPNGKPVDIEVLRRAHKMKGWKDIGYHFVINVDGTVQEGRPLTDMGAHVQGHNQDNIGVCLIGRDRFTGLQFIALRTLLGELSGEFVIPLWEVYGHEELDKAGKVCPNIRAANLALYVALGNSDAIEKYILKETG